MDYKYDERSKWLRALQRGVISQENYDAIIDRLDEEEAHLTKVALDAAYACEDCGSVDPQVHYSNCPLANTRRH